MEAEKNLTSSFFHNALSHFNFPQLFLTPQPLNREKTWNGTKTRKESYIP